MKKLLLIVTCAVLLIGVSVSAAAPANAGVLGMARHFPAETVVFGAIRTDEGYIDDLDLILRNALSGAPLPEQPSVTSIRQALNMGLGEADLSLDDIYGWLGDYAAFGVIGIPEQNAEVIGYLILQITDRAAVEALLERTFRESGDRIELTQAEGYTVYSFEDDDPKIVIGDDVVLFVPPSYAGIPDLAPEDSLVDSEAYQATAEALPADSYNIALYIDLPAFLKVASEQMSDSDMRSMQVLGLQDFGAFAVGLTILDKYSMTVDVVQLAGESGARKMARVDRDFVKHIPADATAVIHTSDFTSLFNQIIDLADAAAAQAGTNMNLRKQVTQGLEAFGFDLEADILSWTTGDYALFFRSEVTPLLEQAATNLYDVMNDPDPEFLQSAVGAFDLGLVVEATDAIKANIFAEKLGTLVSAALSRQPGVEVAQEAISGVEVTAINITTPVGPEQEVTFSLVIGASDNVFFMGTRNAAESIFSEADGLDTNADYQTASQYILPDATSVWYTDGEGFMVGVVGFGSVGLLAMMGPMIGDVFDNIIDELGAPSSRNPLDVRPTHVQSQDEIRQVLALWDYALRLVNSTSISTTITPKGANVTRLVLTFNAQ